MTQNLGGWIHSFTVTDAITHKKGYTIYKITSVVFPRSLPEALTCVTVWKRFHDIKRLYKEMLRRHKTMNLTGEVPQPSNNGYFKRFDTKVIQSRKEYIVMLLDFIAQHPALYKSHPFMHFFEDDHSLTNSPKRILSSTSNIEAICDKLDIQFDNNITLIDPSKETTPDCPDMQNKPTETSNQTEGNKLDNKENHDVPDYSKMLTPMASTEDGDGDYIYEAALEFSKAVQAEVNLEYGIAYASYKNGVDALLSGAKDDCNEERKLIAMGKVTKYMARAEDIYEKFLQDVADNDKMNFRLSVDVSGSLNSESSSLYLERPWNHLAKYKVLRIIDKVMLVQNVTDKSVFIMKGIEKPSTNSHVQSVCLPQSVPYMVRLIAFFESEQKIFLLLQQAKGGKLFDYVRSYAPSTDARPSISDIFIEVDPVKNSTSNTTDELAKSNTQDSGFSDTLDIPNEAMDVSQIVNCSKKLLESVSHTLDELRTKEGNLSPVSQDDLIHQRLHSMASKVSKSPKKKLILPEASVKQWAKELITTVHALHCKGVILGDLYTDNLLLGSNGQLLLSYFYQNTDEAEGAPRIYNRKAYDGHFVAPERPLTEKSDWWSCGVVLFELLLGVPFIVCHPGHIELYGAVQFPAVEISDAAADLLERLLQVCPDARIDYEQISGHPFFKDTNWDELAQNGLNST